MSPLISSKATCGSSSSLFTTRDKCRSSFLVPSPKVPGKSSHELSWGKVLNSGELLPPESGALRLVTSGKITRITQQQKMAPFATTWIQHGATHFPEDKEVGFWTHKLRNVYCMLLEWRIAAFLCGFTIMMCSHFHFPPSPLAKTHSLTM